MRLGDRPWVDAYATDHFEAVSLARKVRAERPNPVDLGQQRAEGERLPLLSLLLPAVGGRTIVTWMDSHCSLLLSAASRAQLVKDIDCGANPVDQKEKTTTYYCWSTGLTKNG